MKVSTNEVSFEALDALGEVDALLLFVGQDERPLQGLAGLVDWRMVGGLSRVLKNRFFEGELEDWLLVPTAGRFPFLRVFVLGIGPLALVSADRLSLILMSAGTRLQKAGMTSVALEIPAGAGLDEETRVDRFRQKFLPAFQGAHVVVLGPRPLQKFVASATRELSERSL